MQNCLPEENYLGKSKVGGETKARTPEFETLVPIARALSKCSPAPSWFNRKPYPKANLTQSLILKTKHLVFNNNQKIIKCELQPKILCVIFGAQPEAIRSFAYKIGGVKRLPSPHQTRVHSQWIAFLWEELQSRAEKSPPWVISAFLAQAALVWDLFVGGFADAFPRCLL